MPKKKIEPLLQEVIEQEIADNVVEMQAVTEVKPLPAVLDGWLLLRVAKVWGQVKFLGSEPIDLGESFMGPHAREIVVAYPITGRIQGERPVGTISWVEWQAFQQSLIAVQYRAADNARKSNDTLDRGF